MTCIWYTNTQYIYTQITYIFIYTYNYIEHIQSTITLYEQRGRPPPGVKVYYKYALNTVPLTLCL